MANAKEGIANLNLDLIAAASELNQEKVLELLKEGASAAFMHDPEGVWGSCDSKSALHAALQPSKGQRGSEEWHTIVKSLIDAKSDVNAIRKNYDWRGCGSSTSAFEMVLPMAMKDVNLLELFLQAGADANTKSVYNRHSMRTDGRSIHYVIHTAVRGKDLEITRALLEARADVNAVSSDIFHNERGFDSHTEETALHQSCAAQDLAMGALLLARGAEVNAVRQCLQQEDSGLESPTDDPRDPEFVSSVRCVPVKESALHIAIQGKNPNLILMLVCAGADTTFPRSRGKDQTTCEELCASDDQLLDALRAKWTPETHHLFPPGVREQVKMALLIAKRQKWPLPDTVLFRALSMAASGPGLAADEEEAKAPQAATDSLAPAPDKSSQQETTLSEATATSSEPSPP